MSASIIKPTQYGTEASFFRMGIVGIDRDALQVTIIIKGYVSEVAWKAKAAHITTRDYFLEGEWLDPYLNDLENSNLTMSQVFEMFYELTVGQDSYFAGAVRV